MEELEFSQGNLAPDPVLLTGIHINSGHSSRKNHNFPIHCFLNMFENPWVNDLIKQDYYRI